MREINLDIAETLLHVARYCPHYEHFRQDVYKASTESIRKTWPACFWRAGFAPRDQEVYKRNTALPDFDYDEPDPPIRTPMDVAAEFHRPDHHGKFRMVVAGDGACPNQGTKLARAGQGAYYGNQHSHNSSFRAEGPCQSSDRAELRCLLRVLRWAPIPTEYLTDNMAVQIGYDKLTTGKRPQSVWKEHDDMEKSKVCNGRKR